MIRPRIIPVILIKNGYVVKTHQFKDERYIGEPINIIKIFNDKEADEVVVYDIGCSSLSSEINFSLIKRIAMVTRMPLCYGGGIKNINQAYEIFSYGVEKISLGFNKSENVKFVENLIKIFGSQSIIITLDINYLETEKKYFIGRKNVPGPAIIDLIYKFQDLGVGEIVFNCIHRDGTRIGYDTNFINMFYDKIKIPSTIVGGASSTEELLKLSERYKYLSYGIGSLFIYKGKNDAILINYPESITKKN